MSEGKPTCPKCGGFHWVPTDDPEWIQKCECIRPRPAAVQAKREAACLVCGAETSVVVNIRFKAVPVCDACCLAITKQTVAALGVQR